MLPVKEIRRRNLLVLEAEAQSLKAIGDAMVKVVQRSSPGERAPDYANVLSQHKGGKSMGDKIARLIEEAMGRPEGWMDSPQFSDPDVAMQAKEAAQLVANMTQDDREAWMKHGRLLAEKNPKRSAGNPFGHIPKGGRPQRDGGTQ